MITISNDLSTESLLARRALAEKATPGPWFFTYNYTPIFDSYGDTIGHIDKNSDAAFVAANDPTTVIATIGEIIRLRGEVERLEKEADWLAENCWKKTDCEDSPPRILRDGICYECSHDCRKCWREAARRATEEER